MMDLVRIPAIAPIELVRLQDELDGQDGDSRAVDGLPQIAAQDDVDAVKAWLAHFADTLAKVCSYCSCSVCFWFKFHIFILYFDFGDCITKTISSLCNVL